MTMTNNEKSSHSKDPDKFPERRSESKTAKVYHPALDQPKTALVLTGGGARAAYQVGVLKAISKIMLERHCKNPFPIITGTSAGAINAAVLASYAHAPAVGIKSLEKVWKNFSVDQVFRSDFKGVMQNAGRWTKSIFVKDYHKVQQLSLLNNTPLKKLLDRVIHYKNIQKAIDEKHLDALCITASGYASGQSVSFFQAKASLQGWKRHRRIGVRSDIGRKHLIASSAIPLVFPAVKINREFFGDGSVRFLSPLSPAIHLGADKILVVGVDPIRQELERNPDQPFYPTTADIAGHVMDSVFVDSLDSDIEQINRINKMIELIPKAVLSEKSKLKPIKTLSISPSRDLSELSGAHFGELPSIVKFFFRRIGIDDDEGSTVVSYLLFEKAYTQELLDLGFKDAMAMKQEICEFFETSNKENN
ncbi:MAG: patatin-like phospholipase family protein [Kangiellaceae bacterium]|nr:patatin-like phospholipase family protein [Kangiellaceae bacterium]